MSSDTHSQQDKQQENHHLDHDHPHVHEHSQQSGIYGWISDFIHPHSHDHRDLAADRAFAENQTGIRTVWLALAALTVTSLLQLGIVFASGSVALLADTAHNIGDGLNSVPLLIAFYLARKLPTQRFTYGYGRAEDIAGIFIVLSILVSAGIVFWESFQRLLNPEPLDNIGWVAAAALVGFLGNEAVAAMQIRAGEHIGSAALVADGLHARTDGLTSLAVLFAAAGAWLGLPLVDPLIGLLIGVTILFITWDAAKRIWFRLMDAVEPEIVAKVKTAVTQQAGVQSIERLRLRWIGHQLQGDIRLTLQRQAAEQKIKSQIHQALNQAVPKLADLTIEIINHEQNV